MALRLRRGTNAERLTITPALGELIYTTDTKLVYVGDGNTAGGNLSIGHSNGNVSFETVSVSFPPTSNTHLATKLYVDQKVLEASPPLISQNVDDSSNTSNTISETSTIQFNTDDGLNLVSSGNTAQIRLNQPLKTTSNVTFNTIEHSGLVLTQGTNIDQYYELSQLLQITTGWQDTSIVSTSLPTGTYIVQIYANDASAGGGHTNEYYSGIMSWYSSDTNSTVFDEIVLHRAGQGPGSGAIFLRVQRTLTADTDDLKLQISSTVNGTQQSLYTFKFRRLL